MDTLPEEREQNLQQAWCQQTIRGVTMWLPKAKRFSCPRSRRFSLRKPRPRRCKQVVVIKVWSISSARSYAVAAKRFRFYPICKVGIGSFSKKKTKAETLVHTFLQCKKMCRRSWIAQSLLERSRATPGSSWGIKRSIWIANYLNIRLRSAMNRFASLLFNEDTLLETEK